MAEVGYATLGIVPSFDGFERNLTRGTSGPMAAAGLRGGNAFGDAAGKRAGSRFGGAFKKAAKVSLIGLGALGVGAFKLAGDSISAASDLNESLNAVNVTYGKQSRAVKKLGREAAQSLGLSNTEFNSLSVRFSAFSKTIAGGGGRKVVTTLDDLTTRASDFASVMNLDVSEAAELFQSGLAGETEPLRKFGIDLSAAKVEAFALAEGIVKSKDELDESAKVQARYASLMDQTAKTQGDFANTSDQLANKQRILSKRWEDAKAKLGTALLPAMEDFVGFVEEKGLPVVEDFSKWFNKDGIPAIQSFAGEVKDAWREAEKLVGFLKDLPTSIKIGGLAGIFGAVSAGRKGLQSTGIIGKTRGNLPTNPLYVFSVNGGAAAVGGGAAGNTKLGRAAGKVPMIVSKYGIYGALLASAGIGLKEVYDFQRKDLPGLRGAGFGPGRINEKIDQFFYDDAPILAPNAFDKVRSNALEAQTEAEKMRVTWGNFFKQIEKGGRVNVNREPLLKALTVLGQFKAAFDGLDGRVAQVHIQSVYDRQAGQIGRNNASGIDGEGLGRVMTNDNRVIINGDVRPQNFDEFEKQMSRKRRQRNGGGIG